MVLAERRQSSASGSLRARSPDPVQLSSLRELGAQDPTGSQALQATHTGGASPADTGPGRRPLLLGHRGEGKGHRHLKAWAGPVGGHRELCVPAGHSLPSVRWAPRSPTGRRLDELEGPGKKAGTHLLPHSLPEPSFHRPRLNGTSIGHLLMVARLRDGPTAASTNGQAGPLMVTH